MTVEAFAAAYADFLLQRVHDKRGGKPPEPGELAHRVAEVIRGLVAGGYRAGKAMDNNDIAGWQLHREIFKMTVPLGKHYGLTYGQLDMCYAMGYRAARKGALG